MGPNLSGAENTIAHATHKLQNTNALGTHTNTQPRTQMNGHAQWSDLQQHAPLYSPPPHAATTTKTQKHTQTQNAERSEDATLVTVTLCPQRH